MIKIENSSPFKVKANMKFLISHEKVKLPHFGDSLPFVPTLISTGETGLTLAEAEH